jgi:hypothetical protein
MRKMRYFRNIASYLAQAPGPTQDLVPLLTQFTHPVACMRYHAANRGPFADQLADRFGVVGADSPCQ